LSKKEEPAGKQAPDWVSHVGRSVVISVWPSCAR